MKKTILGLCAILASSFVLTACNTVQGAGKDIERGGEKVQDAAQKTKEKM
jgi:entericidin B